MQNNIIYPGRNKTLVLFTIISDRLFPSTSAHRGPKSWCRLGRRWEASWWRVQCQHLPPTSMCEGRADCKHITKFVTSVDGMIHSNFRALHEWVIGGSHWCIDEAECSHIIDVHNAYDGPHFGTHPLYLVAQGSSVKTRLGHKDRDEDQRDNFGEQQVQSVLDRKHGIIMKRGYNQSLPQWPIYHETNSHMHSEAKQSSIKGSWRNDLTQHGPTSLLRCQGLSLSMSFFPDKGRILLTQNEALRGYKHNEHILDICITRMLIANTNAHTQIKALAKSKAIQDQSYA